VARDARRADGGIGGVRARYPPAVTVNLADVPSRVVTQGNDRRNFV
jgi:hypothetical protein